MVSAPCAQSEGRRGADARRGRRRGSPLTTSPGGVRALVAVGSNEGDRLAFLRFARRGAGALPATRLVAASAVYETAPVGGPPQGPYLNAALLLETESEPRGLLASLAALEAAAARRRTIANGPRTLDLDLLVFGAVVSRDPALTLPHPRFASRAFALVPAADVAPELIVPGEGASVATLLARLEQKDRAGVVRVAEPEEWS